MVTWTGWLPSEEHVPMQYDLRFDPWRVLVCCIALARVHGAVAKPALEHVFDDYPTAFDVVRDGESVPELELMLKPLGLWRQRARHVSEMSRQYVRFESEMVRLGVGVQDDGLRLKYLTEVVSDFAGCGQYAEDSVRIFCARDYTVRPADRVLARFVEQRAATYFFEHGTLVGYTPQTQKGEER